MRYRDAETDEVMELSHVLTYGNLHTNFADSSSSFQLAAVVTEYAELLRESYWAQEGSLDSVLTVAQQVAEMHTSPNGVPGKIAEFVALVEETVRLRPFQKNNYPLRPICLWTGFSFSNPHGYFIFWKSLKNR